MRTPHGTRHLIYYVYPVADNGVWQRNVAALKKRADLFNGSRVVAVAEQAGRVNPKAEGERRPPHTVDPWERVADALGDGFACMPVPNHLELGEVPAFRTLLQHGVTTHETGNYTFYGHAKGVTRPFGPGVTVHPWTALLYAANLDYWPLVERALATHPVCGALRKTTHPFTVKRVCVRENGTIKYRRVVQNSRWHYSGTFFWFRNDALPSITYWDVDDVWGGVEFWPGKHWPEQQGHCLFGQHTGTAYSPQQLETLAEQFTAWSCTHAADRRDDASAEPWLEYCGYGVPCT